MEDTVVPTAPRMPIVHLLEDKTADPVSADIPSRVDKKTLSYLAMAMAALVVIAGVGIAILNGRSRPAIPVASNLPTLITSSPAPLPPPVATATITPEPTVSLPAVNGAAITQAMQTTQESQTPAQGFCTTVVSKEDIMGLSGILQKFKVDYYKQQEYQSCKNAECSQQALIPDHDKIQPGLIIVIPAVSKPTCDTGGGTWIISKPDSLP
jgi:hypothetical protein